MIRHVAQEARENPSMGLLVAVTATESFREYGLRQYLTPTVGFAALAGLVVGFDLIAPKTLTRGFHDTLESHPVLSRLAVAGLATHLALPKLDPIRLVYDVLK